MNGLQRVQVFSIVTPPPDTAKDKRRYRVKWRIDGRDETRAFKTRAQADRLRSRLQGRSWSTGCVSAATDRARVARATYRTGCARGRSHCPTSRFSSSNGGCTGSGPRPMERIEWRTPSRSITVDIGTVPSPRDVEDIVEHVASLRTAV